MKLRFALCAVGALLGACGDSAGQIGGDTGDQSQAVKEIIGGFDAKSASLNAVGTIGVIDPDTGAYSFFCTATLIAPKRVLTAKQCAMITDSQSPLYKMKLVNLQHIFFAVGPNALAPVQLVEAIATDLSPVEEGGFNEIGNDLAVMHLIAEVKGVTPIPVADLSLSDKDVGQPYVSIGFGSKDIYEDVTGMYTATRSAGKNTLRALSGQSFALMLGSWDAFYKQMCGVFGKDIVDEYIDIVLGWYEDTKILTGYEAWVGYSNGDVQTCNGDNGGPLIGREMGEKKIFGVASANWFSSQKTCDYGTFYATVGVETRTMLAESAKYVDPCANGITVTGSCNGDVATRCTDKWEGDRRLSQIDCSLLDQVCAVGADKKVACVDASDPGSSSPAPSHAVAPTAAELRKSLLPTTHIQRRMAAAKK